MTAVKPSPKKVGAVVPNRPDRATSPSAASALARPSAASATSASTSSAPSDPSDASAFLLRHFDRLAEAPGGIAKLRALVVQLGIQGKLIAQNEADEPVSNLLARIRSARPKLIAAGEAQKLKDLPEIAPDDLPFEIPDSWQWVRLAEVTAYIQRGKSPAYEPGSTKFVLNQKCIQWDGLHLEYAKEVSGASLDRYEPVRFLRSGDILWNSTGTGTIGRCLVFRPTAQTPPKLAVDGHVTVVRTIEVEPDYIQRWLLSPFVYGVIEERASGATNQVELTSTMSTEQLISLPPLAEQRRIVAKVEELMGLCDALEAAQRERETVRTRLRTSALHQLASPDSDSKSAPFVLQNLSHLTTSPDDFDQLRQSVLQLAVCGRLVSQRSEDKPAALDKVASSSSDFDERVFSEALGSLETPPNWSINPLARTAAAIVDCPHSTPKWTEVGRMCVRTNQFRPGYLDLSDVQFVSEETYTERIQRLEPKEDDVLYSREGGILGVACRVPANIQLCLGQRMMLIRPGSATEPAFLEMVLNSPLITGIALNQTTGGAAPRVNVSTIRAFPIPLPPLAEQRRIVAKVDELMAVLDALEATLTTARTTAEALLAATVAKLHAA